ncbi:4-coumarate--CoA ligase [Choanephora cucurbitarum]|uniref:4-coumarate--CoA ligase n=1 Tax=Choanephora cucurbitarum TaxID=101091 RepID=A0A1C7N3B1_9FUNG|nr:4-coumarate--CoA ligase [Choanephora cucurbitarum]
MVIYRASIPEIPVPNVDLLSLLFNKNEFNEKKDLNAPVFIDDENNKTLSWNQVRDQVLHLASGWIENVGLKQGDTVAVFAPNQVDHAVLYFSLLGAKCTVSPGNPAYTEAEFKHQITNCKASALVTIPALLPVLLKICDKIGLPRSRIFLFGDKEVEGCRPFNSITSKNVVSLPLKGIDSANDVAFICYSSGTTGLAKGVMLTHKNFIAQVVQTMAAEPEEDKFKDDVILGFLPFYHIYGLTSLLLNAYYKVSPVVIMSRYDLELLCQLVQKYKVTLMSIVPPVAVHLAKQPIVTKYDMSSVRLIGCGAAPLSKEHIEALSKRIPAEIKQGYGMTETTSGVITQHSQATAAGSIGVLCANIECKIVNENGEELGDDQEGELLFRGPSVMKGYFENAKANAETFTADGWMRTGDVGKFDSKSGEFFILDRIKELIKYKGYQVAPAELEAILMSLDVVADCCAVGVYDESQATELPRAYVVLQPGVERSKENERKIEEFVAKNVTGHKRLRGGVRFVDVIPKSPSGKILRREVKEWIKKEQRETIERARL